MKKNKNNSYYALILAGGSGERLYPRSRNNKPKQFQKLFGKKTLVEQTYNRITKFIIPENIYISTNQEYKTLTQKILPKIPEENYICEPCKKNTAAAIALSTALINKKNPEAIIASVHSDHVVLNENNFIKVFQNSFQSIEKDPKSIITIGIQPTLPYTGYGYIERKKNKLPEKYFSIYKAIKFVEKPNKETALRYFQKGTFYWNAGYFIFKASHLLDEIKKYIPDMHSAIVNIINNFDLLNKEYNKLPDIPIDIAIMEKTSNLKVIPADLSWSDVGSWDSVSALIDSNKLDNNNNYSEGLTILYDTYNSMILSSNSNKLIATIGLDNIIVVETDDVILISQKGRSEEVKKIVEKLKENKLDYLL